MKSVSRFFVGVLLIGVFVIPQVSSAVTTEELQAQISSLLAMVSSLQAEIVALKGGGTIVAAPACKDFKRNLQIGDSGDDVKDLQDILAKAGYSPDTNGIFGEKTASAISAFQETFSVEVLYPLGLQKGTGFFGPSTRAKVNKLYGCGASSAALAQTNQASAVCTQPPAPSCPAGTMCSQIVPAQTTYQNEAAAKAAGAIIIYRGTCISPTIPSGPSITEFKISHPITNAVRSTTLIWNAVNVVSCTLNGPNFPTDALYGTNGAVSTGALTGDSTYSLTCKNPSGAYASKFLVIPVLPQQSLAVISPNGGEVWAIGKTYALTWMNTTGKSVIVDIIKGTSSVLAVGTYPQSHTSSDVAVPTSWQIGSDYKAAVSTSDGSNRDVSDAPFTVASTTDALPSIKITSSPEANSSGEVNLKQGDKIVVTGVPSNVGTDYTRNFFFGPIFNAACTINSEWVITCTATGAGTSDFYIDVSKGGQVYRSNVIKVKVASSAGAPGATTPTTITLTSISPGAGPAGTNITLYGCGPESTSGYTLIYSGPGVNGSATIPIVATGGGCGYMIVSVPNNLPAGMYTLTVKNNATDMTSTNSMLFVVTAGTAPPPVGTTPPSPVVPIVTLYTNANIINSNTAATLTWSSSGATSCAASGGWSGTRTLSGSESTGNLTASRTYTLTCTGAGGQTTQSVTVTVNPPQTAVSTPITLTSVSPTAGPVGTNVTLYGCGSDSASGFTLIYTGPRSGNTVLSVTLTGGGCGYMSFIVPSDFPAGTYTLSVKNNTTNVTSTNSMTFVVTAAAPANPTIISLSPSSGGQGSSVAIYGSGFSATGNTVSYRDGGGDHTIASGLPSYNGGTLIYVTVPNPSNNGTYNIKVVNNAGVSSNEASFTVTNAVAAVSSESQLASALTAIQQILQSMLKSVSR